MRTNSDDERTADGCDCDNCMLAKGYDDCKYADCDCIEDTEETEAVTC